jgi:hypothetical protein
MTADAVDTAVVLNWVAAYLEAWTTAKRAEVEALFTEDAKYHEWPYATAWIGREDIVEGWSAREGWQKGGWSFDDWMLLAINGDTAVIAGTGVYRELGSFANIWIVRFDGDRASEFRMVNNAV